MKKNELPCYIVNDLLPLYMDGLLSPETKAAVSCHLEHCPSCSRQYAAMEEPIHGQDEPFKTNDTKAVNFLKKEKRMAVKKILAAILGVTLIFSALFYGIVFQQQAFHFETRNLYQLSNGDLYFELVPSESESAVSSISYSDEISAEQDRYEIHMGYSLSTLWQSSPSALPGRVYCFTIAPVQNQEETAYMPVYYTQGNETLLIWDGEQALAPAPPEIEEKVQTMSKPFGVEYSGY